RFCSRVRSESSAIKTYPPISFKYWFGQVNKQHLKDIGGYVLMAITAAIATPLALMQLRLYLVNFAGWESAGQWQAVWKISEVYLSIITIGNTTLAVLHISTFISSPLFILES
ncbi:hypothetical protein ACUODJ_45720, partial [Escherichia sp. HC-CC]